jgi:uncharacterized membrane protein
MTTMMIVYLLLLVVVLVVVVVAAALTQYCSGDKIEKNEMGTACTAYGGEKRRKQGFGGGT